MNLLGLVLVYSVALLSSASCGTVDMEVYEEFVEKMVNFKGLKRALEDNLPEMDNDTSLLVSLLDASTKIPSGLLAGNFFDLGHFDECYRLEYGGFHGKYCLGTLPLSTEDQKYVDAFNIRTTKPIPQIHPQPRLMGLGQTYTGFHWAACILSNMSAVDLPGPSTFTEEMCYSKATEPGLSGGAIATIVVLAVFAAISLVSTLFDVYLYYTEKKSPHDLLVAFSFLTNGRKITTPTTNPDQLLCLNGLKAISMMWVILGHEFSTALDAPLYNFLDVPTWENDSANMIITGATVSVDTFFVVGGLVTVYTFMRSMAKGANFNVLMYYVHRYLRLTPALIIMTLIHLYLLNYLGNGPLWKVMDVMLVQPCETGWWGGLLYIANYVQRGYCLPQSWYLSVDMQLFVLSPILLIPLYRWPKPTLGALGLLAVAGCVVPFAVGYAEKLPVSVNAATQPFLDNYYYATYSRFGPYVIGMILGYFIYQIKKSGLKKPLPKSAVCGLWLVTLTALTACVYAGYPLFVATEEDRWGNAMYLGFNRPAWSVALCGLIFLCVAGYGHPIDWFLSRPVFQFLTKLSYSMYLVHYSVVNVRYSSMKNTIKFSTSALFYIFWSDFMVTLGLSLLLCLMFESPVIILEKYLFGRGAPKKVRGDKDNSKV